MGESLIEPALVNITTRLSASHEEIHDDALLFWGDVVGVIGPLRAYSGQIVIPDHGGFWVVPDPKPYLCEVQGESPSHGMARCGVSMDDVTDHLPDDCPIQSEYHPIFDRYPKGVRGLSCRPFQCDPCHFCR